MEKTATEYFNEEIEQGKLLNTVQESPYSELPTIKEESSMLSEILDNQIDCYDQSIDPDARIGHKAVNSSFYGYKTQILAASIRHTMHIIQSMEAGADVATCPLSAILGLLKHPLTDSGLDTFLKDYNKLNK